MRRLPTLLLVIFAAWEVLCFSDNVQLLLGETRRLPALTWPATWQMFTSKATRQESLGFEGRYGEVWVPLPMHEWLTARWESGYRFERASNSGSRLRPFLVYACEHSGADEVRLRRRAWRRVLGAALQPEKDTKVETRGSRRCR
jgi:hypothetical protein